MIGIYLLKQDEEVVYVGQSKNINKRIKSHITKGSKKFNSWSCFECKKSLLDSTEIMYIQALNPIYNLAYKLDNRNTPKGYREKEFNQKKTHVQLYVKDKEKLEKMRDKNGYASIAVMVKKLLEELK